MKKTFLSKILLPFILLLGIGLRLYNLGENSLWSDEVGFIFFRTGNLSESFKFACEKFLKEGFGIANYGYSLFTIFWSCLADNEFMLRLSSVIFGVLCIFFIYKIGKLFFDKKIGTIAAFLLAVSPFHIYYSQEFRMYSLITLLTLTSVYFLRRFQETGKYTFLFGYAFSHILNFYMHIVTILILISQIMFFIFYRKRYKTLLKKWLIGNVATISLIIPGMILTTIELTRYRNLSRVLALTVSSVSELGSIKPLLPLYTFKNFCIGYNVTSLVWIPALLLFFSLSIWALIKISNKEILHLCLLCLCTPVFIMYFGQRFLYSDRYLIFSSVFLYLIASNGIAYLNKTSATIALALVSMLSFFSLNNYYKDYFPVPHEQRCAVHEKKAIRETVSYIISNFQKEDIIFHVDSNTALPFEYYFNYYLRAKSGRSNIFDKEQIALVLEFSEAGKDLYVSKAWVKIGSILSKTNIPVKGHKRIWLIFSAREFNEALLPGSREKRVLQWINNYYIKEEEKYFKGIILYLFRNPAG